MYTARLARVSKGRKRLAILLQDILFFFRCTFWFRVLTQSLNVTFKIMITRAKKLEWQLHMFNTPRDTQSRHHAIRINTEVNPKLKKITLNLKPFNKITNSEWFFGVWKVRKINKLCLSSSRTLLLKKYTEKINLFNLCSSIWINASDFSF